MILEQRIAVERIYNLGDYKNIKLISELTQIPQSIALNEEALSKLQYLLLVEIEQSYVQYHRIMKEAYRSESIEKSIDYALKYLETERTQTFNQLSQILKSEGK
jgi:hypothetical protein